MTQTPGSKGQTDGPLGPDGGAERPLARTPVLEQLLGRLRSQLLRLAIQNGLGWMLLALVGATGFAFAADYFLSVPKPVRLWHAALVVGLPLFVGWRFGVRAAAQIPTRAGLALLAERADPGAKEVLVSAVAFQRRPPPAGPEAELERALVDRVLAQAERRAATLNLEGLFDRRRPRRQLAAGSVAALALAGALAAHPNHARAFFARLAGADHPWPNATELFLEVPLAEGAASIEPLGDHGVTAQVPRGSDVPVVVRALGKAPAEVTLAFGDGRRLGVPRQNSGDGRGATYRTVLRGVQEDISLVASGGSDGSERARLNLIVLQPPEVVGLAIRVEPPPHTGLPAELVFDRGVRVVEGSKLFLALRTDPEEISGHGRLLPMDTLVPLAPRPFPGAESSAAPSRLDGWGFELEPTASLRVRFEVLDSRGLANPDPGLFAVDVAPDRPPEVEQLAPTRLDLETSARGAVRLTMAARDDFGLTRFAWRARDAASEDWTLGGDLELGAPPVVQTVASLRVDVAAWGGGEESALLGSQFALEAYAVDNHPSAREGRGPLVRVRILGDDELLRRVQERLGRARAQASALSSLQRERRERVGELLSALEQSAPGERADPRLLTSAQNGQRRVQADAEALLRELTGVAELVLYARLDSSASGLLDPLDEALSAAPSQAFQLEPWERFLAAHRPLPGTTPGMAQHILGLARVGLSVHQSGARTAVAHLEAALAARDGERQRAELEGASLAQGETLRALEDLLERLSEWDDFQSVLTQAREMLDRQRGLRERTRRYANER